MKFNSSNQKQAFVDNDAATQLSVVNHDDAIDSVLDNQQARMRARSNYTVH